MNEWTRHQRCRQAHEQRMAARAQAHAEVSSSAISPVAAASLHPNGSTSAEEAEPYAEHDGMDFDDHGSDLNAEQPIADSNQLDLAYFQAMSQSSPAFHVLRPGMSHLHMILYVSVDDSCIDV